MRMAVLGLGFMGSTHVRAIRSIADAQLVAVFSSDESKLQGDLTAIRGNLGTTGERLDFSGVAKYSDIDAVLRDPDVDAVDICLPTHVHEDVALRALAAGKHVFVEKPLALDGDGADRVVQAARRAGRTLMAGHVLRFLPAYRALAEIVRERQLGHPRNLVFRRRCAAPDWSAWLNDPARSGGGIFDLLIHDADFAVHLFGWPQAVSATGHEDLERGIDVIEARLHYESGPAVTIAGGWYHKKAFPFSMDYTAVFDDGTIEYRMPGDTEPTLYRDDGTAAPLPLLPGWTPDGFVAELDYFVAACRGGWEPVLCPPEQSAQAVRLMRLLQEARRHDGERIVSKA